MEEKLPTSLDKKLLPALFALQIRLSLRVRLTPLAQNIETVAGCDVAFAKEAAVAVAVLYRLRDLKLLETALARGPAPLPYIPGFLSFRETPCLLKAIRKLRQKPDVILVDGQGIAHPRGLGLASHLGLMLGIPSIGCAKSKLVGSYREPASERGSLSCLFLHHRPVGMVVRTRARVRPVFVSPGHLITLAEAVQIVLKLSPRYRLPEPLRMADRLTKLAKKGRLRPGDDK